MAPCGDLEMQIFGFSGELRKFWALDFTGVLEMLECQGIDVWTGEESPESQFE